MPRSIHDVVPGKTGDCGGPFIGSMDGDTMTIYVAGVWQCWCRATGGPCSRYQAELPAAAPPDTGALNRHSHNNQSAPHSNPHTDTQHYTLPRPPCRPTEESPAHTTHTRSPRPSSTSPPTTTRTRPKPWHLCRRRQLPAPPRS